jgi:glycosyltransferase involved in cell wall biosynthesis
VAVVANSEGLKQLALCTAANLPVKVIPNGVDVQQFHPAAATPAGLEVLCVARLIPRKGLHHLVEAMPLVSEARLTIAGSGTEQENLEALAARLGVGERVRFLGAVPHGDLPEVYRAASVFVLPSMNEGVSNTVLEAMASGLPVLLTDTGGTSELLASGENGFLIDATPESIARALQHYLREPQLEERQAAASRKRAESMSWAAAAQAYVELFDQHFARGSS